MADPNPKLEKRNSKLGSAEPKAPPDQPDFAGAGEALGRLIALTARLRGPGGCPWDRAQGYDSMKALLLEEAYEVIDAVNARNFEAIEEELGDLVFQVIFYARLAEEDDRFKLADVLERLHAKLVRRHPHVFGEVRANTAEEALASWNSVKERERERKKETSLLDGMAAAVPALIEAHQIGVRVAEAGFDWPNAQDVLGKVREELEELRRELAANANPTDGRRLEEELGDLLFSVGQLARHLHTDAESCLRLGNQKFRRRFQALEREFARRGRNLAECDLAEMESVWNSIKSEEGTHDPADQSLSDEKNSGDI